MESGNIQKQIVIGFIFMKCMRGAGLSIEVLVEYITLFQQGNLTNKARKELLIEQPSRLAENIK